ncbi:MAG: peptidase inhibitor family I36 protein [Microbacterium sp.]|nr:peptidase inhibitor family I36 protein [Microbacterium sp.]
MSVIRSKRLTRTLSGAIAVVGLSLVTLAAAPAAQASGTGATCPVGRFCLYFNSNQQGARADLVLTDAAFNNELFNDGPVGANGWKVLLGNNAASYWNRTGTEIIVFDGTSCTFGAAGRAIGILPGKKENLPDDLKNRISSMKVTTPTDGYPGCSDYNPDQSKY